VTLGHIYALQVFSGDSRIGQKVSETMVPESGGSGEMDEELYVDEDEDGMLDDIFEGLLQLPLNE